MTSTKEFNIVFAAGSRPALQPYCDQLGISPLSPDGAVIFQLEDNQVTALKVALSNSGIEPTSNWPRQTAAGRAPGVHHVLERTFVVTTAADDFKLKTGYLGPCVAFYGRHKRADVSFMAHIDGYFAGMDELTAQLRHASDDQLASFDLYFCSNYTLPLRFILLILSVVCAAFAWCQSSSGSVAFPMLVTGLALVVAQFFFFSIVKICYYSKRHFGKLPQACMPRQIWGRVEVQSNPNSPTGFDAPRKEWDSPSVTAVTYAVPDRRLHRLVDGRKLATAPQQQQR
ncbi:hypothetical protein [Herbaspirillum huttiense]|uniref:hypothetical protein n=1 Tax=Herbaspirillum huttiense TaxID=863372 RepID=UPI0039B01A90